MNVNLSKWNLIAVIVLGAWLACPATAMARGAKAGATAGHRRARVENHMGTVAQELNLTADQKQQLRPILQEHARELKALRADTSLSQQQKHQKFQQLRQDLLAKLKPILTPEQLDKWQNLRRGMGAKNKRRA